MFELEGKIVPTQDKQFLMLSRDTELKNLMDNPFFKIPFINKTIMTTESNLAKLENETFVNPKGKKFIRFF